MLTKHDERKMPKNLGHIASLARSYTDTAIKTLAGIMMEPRAPARARIAAAAILLDRGWGKAKEMHEHGDPDRNPIEKIVHEFVHLAPMSADEISAAEISAAAARNEITKGEIEDEFKSIPLNGCKGTDGPSETPEPIDLPPPDPGFLARSKPWRPVHQRPVHQRNGR